MEVLIAATLLAIISFGLVRLMSLSQKQQGRITTVAKLEEVRQMFLTVIQHGPSWSATLNDAANPNLACLKNGTDCAGGGAAHYAYPDLVANTFRCEGVWDHMPPPTAYAICCN